MASGYTPCKCHDCFEIAISDDAESPDFCWECEEAGCDGEGPCEVESAYGCTDDLDSEQLSRAHGNTKD